MTLKELLDLYSNWNTNLVINDKNLNLYARVDLRRMDERNYAKVLKAKVMAFAFYDGELCVRVDY